MIGDAALPAGPRFGFEPVDEVDHVVEPTPRLIPDAGPRDRDGEVGLACAADEHDVALVRQEPAVGEVAHQPLVDRRTGEGELGDVLGQG